MPLLRYSNTSLRLIADDTLQGTAEGICQKVCLPAADQPTQLSSVTFLLQRIADEAHAGVGAMAVSLGTTAFAADVGTATVNADSLEPGAVQPISVRAELALTGLVLGPFGYELYVTLAAPTGTRLVLSWHALAPSGPFHGCQSRTAGTVAGLPYPLALTLTAQGKGAATGILPFASADHDQFTRLLSEGAPRKKTRLTLWETDLGLTDPPFPTLSLLPQVRNPVPLREVRQYQATQTDRFNTGSISFDVSLREFDYYQNRFHENAMVTLDEQWGDGTTRTPWLRRGTFLIDTIQDGADDKGERIVTITGRDALKLLMTTQVAQRFWPDKIFVPRKTLTRLRDADAAHLPYHIFADGSVDPRDPQKITKTVMWADNPAAKFWRDNDVGHRLLPARGSFDVLSRDGEVWIEREFYAAGVRYAGLGNPKAIQAQYYRFAMPADEVIVRIVSLDRTAMQVTAVHPQAWRGVTVAVLSGARTHARFKVTNVAPDGSRLYFTSQDLTGLAVGDLVQIVTANRVEDVVRQVLLACGFQDLDAARPFFIESALPPPSANAVTLPADENFDFRYERAKTGFEIVTAVTYWLPPNIQYKANALGNVETVIFNPNTATTYETRDAVQQVTQEKSDQEVYTRIIYRVKNRRYLNLVGFTSPSLVSWNVNDEALGLGGLSLTDVLALVPIHWLANLSDKRERAIRAVTDGVRGSGVEWRLVLDTDTGRHIDPPADTYRGRMNGKWLMEWHLDKLYKLSEIHIRGIDPAIRGVEKDWIKEQYLDLQISTDGALWQTVTDEFQFDDAENPYKQFDVGDNTFAQHLRLVCSYAALVRTTRSKAQFSGTNQVVRWSEAVTLADLFVYADDVIQGVAELGVDRFAGSSDAQFARDQALRTRMGLRTLVIEPADEQGYEISAAAGLTLEQYAKARAMEFLAERVTEFNTVRLIGVRPDLGINDLPQVTLPPVQLGRAEYLIREVTTKSAGTIEALGTDYRYQGGTPGSPDPLPTAGTAPVLAQDLNRTDGGDDWNGVFKP